MKPTQLPVGAALEEAHMIIGIPTEIKQDEYRVAMLPVGVEELVSRKHQVLIQVGAGLGSGLTDDEYLS